MNMAYRSFWTCKCTFGKPWGLKPKVLHWIYIMIIGLVLTYGSTASWPMVIYNVGRMELNKLQRLACLARMAMKTIPTAAMEVLLGFPPVHVIIEVEAQAGIYRLMCNQQWRPKPKNYSHAKKSQDMEKEPIFLMRTDRMILKYVFHKPFKVHLSMKH
jgi:hypothetical protein